MEANNIYYKEVCDRAAQLLEGHFQSKKAKLKKQVTHWIGKFMIVKDENNRLRKKVRKLELRLFMQQPMPDEDIIKRGLDKCQGKSQPYQDTWVRLICNPAVLRRMKKEFAKKEQLKYQKM